MGSAVCVYTLDHMSNDVTTVYGGNFWKIDGNTGESQTVFSSKNLTVRIMWSVNDLTLSYSLYSVILVVGRKIQRSL